MGPGKIASQAGHAYVETILQTQVTHPDRFEAYRADGLGTKVCLAVPTLEQLLEVERKCKEAGIPCALITDSGCPDFFEGKPTITALGVGPTKRHETKKILRQFKLLP
jgi:peptidyl-tRNA hydrolase